MTTTESDETTLENLDWPVRCEDPIHSTTLQPKDEPPAYAIWLAGSCDACGDQLRGMYLMCEPCFRTRTATRWQMVHSPGGRGFCGHIVAKVVRVLPIGRNQ